MHLNDDVTTYTCAYCGMESEVPTCDMEWERDGWMRCSRCGCGVRDCCVIDESGLSAPRRCPACGAVVDFAD